MSTLLARLFPVFHFLTLQLYPKKASKIPLADMDFVEASICNENVATLNKLFQWYMSFNNGAYRCSSNLKL